MKITNLANRPDLYSQTIQLIEKSFNYSKDNSFIIDFAPLMINNSENLFIIEENNQVLAHIGIKAQTLLCKDHEIPVVFIGGIAVDEEYRGKGLFKLLFDEVLKQTENKSALYFLWSDQVQLYMKFDFYVGIGQIETTTEKQDILGYGQTTLNALNSAELIQLQSLYESCISSKYISVKRDEFEHLKQITSTGLYLHKENDQIISYFFCGKGNDLDNVIHELVVPDDKKLELYPKFQHSRTWLPECESGYFSQKTLQYMALTRIGNADLFKKFVEIWSNDKIRFVDINKETIEFIFSDQSYTCKPSEFICYLWGPRPLEEFKGLGPSFYISGLDSI